MYGYPFLEFRLALGFSIVRFTWRASEDEQPQWTTLLELQKFVRFNEEIQNYVKC